MLTFAILIENFDDMLRSDALTLFFLITLTALFSCTQTLFSQDQDSVFHVRTDLKEVFKQENQEYFIDTTPRELRYSSLNIYGKAVYYIDILRDTLTYPQNEFLVTYQDTMIIDPLFLPLVFDGRMLYDPSFKFDPIVPKEPLFPALSSFIVPYNDTRIKDELNWNAYAYARSVNPSFVKYTVYDFPDEVEKTEEIKVNVFRDLFQVENNPDFSQVDKPERFIPKRRYWLKNGSNLIQFSQNYISSNWYKGGTGNLNILSIQNMNINYKKEKIQFNNFIEWRLSLYKNDDDANVRIGEDLFRTYSDFGIQAFSNKWSYSTNLEIKTQLFNNYKVNSSIRSSSLFSPLSINMGILGMKYQLNKTYKNNKYKKVNISADISPLSVQYTYVMDNKVDPTRYGIPAGKNSLLDLGSTINSKLVVNFNKNVSFSSRFKYFTNYEKVIIESENELIMPINRFFSTRIYLYARFDDTPSLPKIKDLGYFQVNELLSFGFNYKW